MSRTLRHSIPVFSNQCESAAPAAPRSRFRAAVGISVLAALAGCQPQGQGGAGLDLSTIDFLKVKDGQPIATLDTRVVSNKQTTYWTHNDLKPALTSTGLNEVMVRYLSDSNSAEVHVFARD